MSEPHVFSEVPCQNLMFFQRFHVRTSSFACFFGGSMSVPAVLHFFFGGSISKLPVLNVIWEVP